MEKINRIEAIVRDRSTLYPCCDCKIERCNRSINIINRPGNPRVEAVCNNLKSSHIQERIEAIGKER